MRLNNGTELRREELQESLAAATKAMGLSVDRFITHSFRIDEICAFYNAIDEIKMMKRQMQSRGNVRNVHPRILPTFVRASRSKMKNVTL